MKKNKFESQSCCLSDLTWKHPNKKLKILFQKNLVWENGKLPLCDNQTDASPWET